MGWSSRLKNGVAGFMNTQTPTSPPARDRLHRGPSLSLTDITASIEAAPGLSQPVWGPEISTVGAYSREGYTSRTFDQPIVPFKAQAAALQVDEDVQLAINHISSMITGGKHYVQANTEELHKHFSDFTRRLNFDTLDTRLIKECIWYGNSVWKPRMGIRQVNSFDDLMHIPISSFQRIWWDRQRIPYKYEFRGAQYQGYHNPGEVLHFVWNPIDASVFGTGFGVSMTSPRIFDAVTVNGIESQELPSLLERKYATQRTMQLAESRYISHNVWSIEGGSEEDRNQLQAQVENLEVGQDVVAGTKVEVAELGSQAKNFNAEQFMDITLGPILKALNDFRGKESGTSTHSYANAAESARLDEIGLAAFPIAMLQQIEDMIIKPWYNSHPMVEMSYLGGMIPVPYEETGFILNFGEAEKQDIPIEDNIKLLELYLNSDLKKSPVTIEKLFEQAGLGLDKVHQSSMAYEWDPELTIQGGDSAGGDPFGDDVNNSNNGGSNENQDTNRDNGNYNREAVPQIDNGGGPVFPDFTSGTTAPPNDMPIFSDMMRDVRGKPPNPNQYWDQGEYNA